MSFDDVLDVVDRSTEEIMSAFLNDLRAMTDEGAEALRAQGIGEEEAYARSARRVLSFDWTAGITRECCFARAFDRMQREIRRAWMKGEPE